MPLFSVGFRDNTVIDMLDLRLLAYKIFYSLSAGCVSFFFMSFAWKILFEIGSLPLARTRDCKRKINQQQEKEKRVGLHVTHMCI